LIDEDRRPARFLILGSASPELLRQSSETLAGRIAYHELTPLLSTELPGMDWKQLINRGGFPNSMLAQNDHESMVWREHFITTFIERDLSLTGLDCTPSFMRRLWLMLAHLNGQIMNYSKLAQSLDVTHPTVKRYLDILIRTFMIFRLEPYHVNIKKRLVKSPKYYFSDPGIFNSFLELGSFDELYHHPGFGSVWEGLAIYNILKVFNVKHPFGFFRTHQGEEIDLIINKKGRSLAFEFKASSHPQLDAKTLLPILDELEIEFLYVITPQSDPFTLLGGRAKVLSLNLALKNLET
jgi:predicted AAA+ superfamily ATPase